MLQTLVRRFIQGVIRFFKATLRFSATFDVKFVPPVRHPRFSIATGLHRENILKVTGTTVLKKFYTPGIKTNISIDGKKTRHFKCMAPRKFKWLDKVLFTQARIVFTAKHVARVKSDVLVLLPTIATHKTGTKTVNIEKSTD